jgi:hypothetical protein
LDSNGKWKIIVASEIETFGKVLQAQCLISFQQDYPGAIDKTILGKFDHRNNYKIILQLLLCHIKFFKLLKNIYVCNSSKVTGGSA